jgi:predicted unusual protein kinase regulating ubiquinone biosynthesis (AarF/ABC1/UbiB family)
VFVTPRPAGADAAAPAWTLTFIDFGMMGTVDDRLRSGLRTVLLAVAARDSKRLVQGILDVGALLPGADTRELERAYAKLFARFGGMGSRSCARSIRASSATSRRSSAMSCGTCRSSCRRTSC